MIEIELVRKTFVTYILSFTFGTCFFFFLGGYLADDLQDSLILVPLILIVKLSSMVELRLFSVDNQLYSFSLIMLSIKFEWSVTYVVMCLLVSGNFAIVTLR